MFRRPIRVDDLVEPEFQRSVAGNPVRRRAVFRDRRRRIGIDPRSPFAPFSQPS
jgi:hypothetical protein